MSFGTYARRVRNRDFPYGLRYSALRCAVSRYRPLGFHATWEFITLHAGGDVRRDEAALLRALDLLEDSRRAQHADRAEFARRRTAEKLGHRRAPTEEEKAYLYGWRWPGPDAHAATVQTVTALWEEHLRVPYPERSSAELDAAVAGIVWTYLEGGGRLHPGHRRLLRECLAMPRGLKVVPYVQRLHKMACLVAHDALPLIRPGWAGDADEVCRVYLAARNLAADEEVRAWVAEVMIPQSELWVAEHAGRVVGFAALRGTGLDHLYVAPDSQGQGFGTALLDRLGFTLVEAEEPSGLDESPSFSPPGCAPVRR